MVQDFWVCLKTPQNSQNCFSFFDLFVIPKSTTLEFFTAEWYRGFHMQSAHLWTYPTVIKHGNRKSIIYGWFSWLYTSICHPVIKHGNGKFPYKYGPFSTAMFDDTGVCMGFPVASHVWTPLSQQKFGPLWPRWTHLRLGLDILLEKCAWFWGY